MKTPSKKTIPRLTVLIMGGVAAVALATTAVETSKEHQTSPPPANVKVDTSPLPSEMRANTSFAPVVKQVMPSVVKVFTTTKAKAAAMQDLPQMDNPLFRQFFGDGSQQFGRQHQFNIPSQHGAGSGVIVTKDGYILTNNHVVDGADTVRVNLTDGREFTAKVIGKDPKSDVAVVKIDAKDLPYIDIADSDKIEVGD